MKIVWARTTKLARNPNQPKPKDGQGKKDGSGKESMGTDVKDDEEVKWVFDVVPATMTLNPKMGYKV